MPLPLLLAPAFVCSAEGPTAPLDIHQILARHLEALGGDARMKAQRSRRVRSTLQGLAPFEVPILVEQTRDRYRREVNIQETVQITAFAEGHGWRVDPFATGASAPQDLKGDDLQDLMEEMDFDGDLVDATSKGHTVRAEGLDRLPSGAAYRLDLLLASGRRSTVWLDAGTFLQVKRVQTRPQYGQPLTVELRYEDYREVGGVKVPFMMTLTPKGAERSLVLRTLGVEVNPPLDGARFARPGA